jgi:hypothetical protein
MWRRIIISNGSYNFSLAASNHSALKSLSLQTCDTSTDLPPEPSDYHGNLDYQRLPAFPYIYENAFDSVTPCPAYLGQGLHQGTKAVTVK